MGATCKSGVKISGNTVVHVVPFCTGYRVKVKLPLEYMCEFYWLEFQDPSPSGLLANSRDTQIIL